MSKLRLWWVPQIGMEERFFIPVNNVEEGKRYLYILTAYDAFQFLNNIKPAYYNAGGLEIFDDVEGEWSDWYVYTNTSFYDNVNEYCESEDCSQRKELEQFKGNLFGQIRWDLLPD